MFYLFPPRLYTNKTANNMLIYIQQHGKINAKDMSKYIKQVEVTTGINNYNYIEIKSGLKEGDVIMASSTGKLNQTSTSSTGFTGSTGQQNTSNTESTNQTNTSTTGSTNQQNNSNTSRRNQTNTSTTGSAANQQNNSNTESTINKLIKDRRNMDTNCTSNNCMIEITNLTKVYKIGKIEVKALRGANLNISKGEFVSIMGPSGSGKSTLMNIIGCLDTPTSGSYLLEGIDVAKLKDNQLAEIRNKKVGFVFQTFNLLARSDAIHNVELPLIYAARGTSKNRRAKIMESLASVGLTGWEKHRPSELSGGERQRVAIARALVNDPAIILADEPTGNLDSVTGEEIMAIFQKLNREGKTILLVTHEHDIAMHTNRIIYLRDGIIPKEEAIDSPIDAVDMLARMPKLEDRINST